jgi:hypothetical protein
MDPLQRGGLILLFGGVLAIVAFVLRRQYKSASRNGA